MKKIITITILTLLAISAWAAPIVKEVYYGTERVTVPWLGDNAMTFMTLVDKDKIDYTGTITKIEWWKCDTSSYRYTGDVYPTIINIGMTTNTVLDKVFENNYRAGSKRLLGTWTKANPYKTPAQSGWYDILLGKSMRYDYDNKYNLILYVTWKGSERKGTPVSVGFIGAHTISRRAYKAPEGNDEFSKLAYNVRLTFEDTSGVAPTSLGRVKALYR